MRIVSLLENKDKEKRVAITPEIAKKYILLGIDVSIPEQYGNHLGFNDNEYKDAGVDLFKDEKDLFDKADIFVQLALPSNEKLLNLKENQSIVGVLNPYLNKEVLDNLVKYSNS